MPGKIDAPLNKKLQEIEWGEYILGDLFDIENTLSFNADRLVEGNTYDYVTRTSLNQGILQSTGFVNRENINRSGVWSLGLLQMDFFYRKREWYAGQFVRKIIPKISIPENCIPFFTAVLNKQRPKLLSVLVRYVDQTFKDTIIKLPVKDGEIDFEFMGNFISELEAKYISELEEYLSITGLGDTCLSVKEEHSLVNYRKIQWGKFKIGDLFNREPTKKLPYKADELPQRPFGKYVLPCLTSSFRNQGLNYYAPEEGATVLKNVISIPSNSDVYRAYFQSREFTVLSDAYAISWKSFKTELSANKYLFMVMCINKVTNLPIYSYKNKLGGWNVVKNKHILLPLKDGQIDFDFMENIISAIQKLMIRDVVVYSNRKIGKTEKAVYDYIPNNTLSMVAESLTPYEDNNQ